MSTTKITYGLAPKYRNIVNPLTAKGSLKGNALAFLLPILGLFKIEFGGDLFAHEVILLILFPILLLKNNKLLTQKYVVTILALGLLWLASQIVTDIFRETPQEDFLRGWAKIIFFMISFCSLVMLLTTSTRVFLWIASSAIPMFIRPFQLFALDLDPLVLWKFGVGSAILFAVCLPSLWRIFNDPENITPVRRIAWLSILFGVGSFFLNARSFAGISIATGALLGFYASHSGTKLRMQTLSIGIFIAFLGAIALINVYSAGASSGFFGEEAQAKYEMQNAYGGGTMSVLLGGRAEGLVSTQAIADSPLLGHGSWAKDYKYLYMYVALRSTYSEEQGDSLDPSINDGLIPTHSYLLGAWVEAGVLGGIFWISVVWMCLFRILPVAFEVTSGLSVYVLMTLPFFMWNILFSPFGANVRVEAAGTLAIFMTLLCHQLMVARNERWVTK